MGIEETRSAGGGRKSLRERASHGCGMYANDAATAVADARAVRAAMGSRADRTAIHDGFDGEMTDGPIFRHGA